MSCPFAGEQLHIPASGELDLGNLWGIQELDPPNSSTPVGFLIGNRTSNRLMNQTQLLTSVGGLNTFQKLQANSFIIRRYRGKPTFWPYQHCTGPTFNPTTCTATQGSQIWYSNLATAQAPFGHPASSPHRWHPGSPQHGASSASWSRPANEKMLEIRWMAGLEYTHVSFKYSYIYI